MAETLRFLAVCGWYLLPMGFANIAPVLVRNRLRFLAIPVDNLFGKRGIFGSHKTVRGLLAGVAFGTVGFWWQQLIAQELAWARHFGLFDYPSMSLWFGVLAGAGAILGDLLRSAVKRRVHIRPGGRFLPWDQLDYVTFGIVFTLPFFRPPWGAVLAILAVGFFLHIAFSGLGHALGMKKDRF